MMVFGGWKGYNNNHPVTNIWELDLDGLYGSKIPRFVWASAVPNPSAGTSRSFTESSESLEGLMS